MELLDNTLRLHSVLAQHSTYTKKTRSKALVEELGGLDLAISYEKVTEKEITIANAVLEKINSLGLLPTLLGKNEFDFFGIYPLRY